MSQLAGMLPALRDRRVAVLGEAILDSWLHGHADRISREAPVPIVALDGHRDAPGGAANAAVNVARLGGQAHLLSVVGDDAEADRLAAGLQAAGVDDGAVLRDATRRTLAKQRLTADGQMLVRFDTGSAEPIGAAAEGSLIERVAALGDVDALLVSDYGYGIVTERVLAVLAERRSGRLPVLVVDARDLRRYRRLHATAVKPNYEEAVRLLGEREVADRNARSRQVGRRGGELLELTGARIVALTVDTDGAFVFERDQPAYRTYARPQSHSRAAGAGDSFVAALTLALAAGLSTPVAAELAQAAAGVVVGKDGTAACGADELAEALSTAAGKRLESAARLAARVAIHREQGRRIVFTNGVFDILHRGHITYLNRAKALGDVLIVAVNADAGVRRLKGPERPINGLDDRLEVLEALSCVDHVVAFEEDTPEALISAVRPDVFAKGGDYTADRLPEAALVESLGGSVQILPYIEERSTSGVIERVRAGATGLPAATAALPNSSKAGGRRPVAAGR